MEPISAGHPELDLALAYEVLEHIGDRRRERGWIPVGRKIGFTNRAMWPRAGLRAPMWAPVWDRTLHAAADGHARLSLGGLPQPRIEPEVVFRLGGPVTPTGDPAVALPAVEAVAAGFEVVFCPYPDWTFTAPDAVAAFGLHGALVVGPWVTLDDMHRSELLERLSSFEASLRCDGVEVDRGVGTNVLGSPALALAELASVLSACDPPERLVDGEVITTGTVTAARPVSSGETWTCDYGTLGVEPIRLSLDERSPNSWYR